MNTAVNRNLVHESESQRQFARIKIPAKLIVQVDNGIRRYKLADLSAGGFAFVDTEKEMRQHHYSGHVEFCIEGFSFVMPIQFDVKSITKDGRIGCNFQGMSSTEISSLRHIIAAFLSGELVTAGDMLNILSRDNFTKVRVNKVSEGLSGFAKIKAVSGSIAFFVIGLLAFAFVATKVGSLLFVAKSTSGEVVVDSYTVSTPREGVVTLNVAEGERVKAGQLIGGFSSPLFSYLSDSVGVDKLTPEAIANINEQSYSGGLVSPCDCLIDKIIFQTGGYAARGEPLVRLVPAEARPHLEATFTINDYQYLKPGAAIKFDVGGRAVDAQVKSVETIRDAQGNLRDLVKVIAEPVSDALTGLVGLPTQARVNRLTSN